MISRCNGQCTESFPTVSYNGFCYATINGANPSDTSIGCDSISWGGPYSMPSGWNLAPDSADSAAVASSYPWGTHVLLYGVTGTPSGCTGSTTYDPTDSQCALWYIIYESGQYSTNNCHLRVLIRKDPTDDPTANPSAYPTSNPTFANCDERGEIKYVDWYQLQNNQNNGDQIPDSNLVMTFNEASLELTFDIDLEYIGLSSNGDWDKAYNLPTTYVIDFQSFEVNGDLIDEPGTCQNRVSSSFDGIADFNQFWGYSEYPYLSGHLGSNSYLSYPPPSQYWTLSIEEGTCTPISYNGTFSWNDLSQCTDYDGNSLINVVDDGSSITLSGTLYINLVSPYSISSSDSGFYKVYQLIAQDFELSINKQSNVLSSTGTELFITSIIGINEDTSDGSFELSILTQSADYIQLTNPSILSSPYGTDLKIEEATTSCLVSSSFTCGQIFTISVNQSLVNCPPASFVGDYNMEFTAECPGNDEVCNTFLDDNGGSSVILGVTSNFVDNDCEAEIYDIIFDGVMTFYDDGNFEKIHNVSDDYIIGQDPIFVQIQVNFPEDGTGDNLNIFGVEIDNVFVCTADDGVDLSVDLDQQNGSGGCLSASIDADGPYDIILNGVENALYGTNIISNGDILPNVVQFSFLPFDIGRTTMYIHTQITLVLQNGNRRRLQVSSSNLNSAQDGAKSNQIRHFISSISVNDYDEVTTTRALVDDNNVNPEKEGDEDKTDEANKFNAFYASLILLLISLFYSV